MPRTYKLSHFTKGTGAAVEPVEDASEAPRRERLRTRSIPAEPRRPKVAPERRATPLPPGHVRKKSTGEIGRIQAVDPKAGTATVLWLRHGQASTVPLSAITRR